MPSRSLAQNLPDHTLIIGGGAIGLASAWALANAGARVSVIDANAVGQGAVWASGGMLAAGFEACFELEPDHPLAEPYAAFLRSSQRLWREWAPMVQAQSDAALGYDQQGSVTPAFRTSELERLDQAEALARRFGVLAERVDGATLAQLEPSLAPAKGALVFPQDGQIDNRAMGEVFKQAITARGGEVIEQTCVQALVRNAGRVTGVRLQDGTEMKADCVVIATGADQFSDMPEFARMTPVKGQMIRFDWPRQAAPQRVVRALSIYLAAKSGGRLIAGASSEPGETSLETDADTIARLSRAAQAALPGLGEAVVVEHWAGLRPRSRDSMPIVGSSEPGLFVALGAYRNGVLAAPGMAMLLLEALGTTPSTAATDFFSADRLGLRS